MPPVRPLANRDLDLILAHTALLWEEARGQQIFLTGGTGFFGCWLIESFCHIQAALKLDARITVLTRNPALFTARCPHLAQNPAVSLYAGDVRDFTYPHGEFRYIVHAAADTNARTVAAVPLDTFSTIIRGTERVLQFAADSGTTKFLFTSSGAVYGQQPTELTHVPETYNGAPNPTDPASVYGEAKRAAELLCAVYQKSRGIACKIARCWAFCGPHLPLDQHFAIGNFIGDVLAGRSIQIQGDGTPRRSYLYAADLTIWLWTLLFRAPALVPFNVGSAHHVSILELAQEVASALNPNMEIRVARQAIPGTVPARYVPSVDRARDLLGLSEITSIRESICRTAQWYSES